MVINNEVFVSDILWHWGPTRAMASSFTRLLRGLEL